MWGEGPVAGSQPMETAVHITWHGAQINFGDLTPYLTYGSVVLQLLLSLSCYVRPQSTQRVAMATFSRTLHHDGKISPALWGGGVHTHPLSLSLSSRAKVWCMYAPAKRADTLPLFLLYLICTLWLDSPNSLYSTYKSDITMLPYFSLWLIIPSSLW